MKDNTKYRIAVITAFLTELTTAILQITGVLPEYKINWLELVMGLLMIMSICFACYYAGKTKNKDQEKKDIEKWKYYK